MPPRAENRRQQVFVDFVSQKSKFLGQWSSNPVGYQNHPEGCSGTHPRVAVSQPAVGPENFHLRPAPGTLTVLAHRPH